LFPYLHFSMEQICSLLSLKIKVWSVKFFSMGKLLINILNNWIFKFYAAKWNQTWKDQIFFNQQKELSKNNIIHCLIQWFWICFEYNRL
jgi:hypothetical protein